jgi:hypothetical protein
MLVDDINIFQDCGSPDWCPEPTSSEMGERISSLGNNTVIFSKSALDTCLGSNFRSVNDSYRISPSLDLVLRDVSAPGPDHASGRSRRPGSQGEEETGRGSQRD